MVQIAPQILDELVRIVGPGNVLTDVDQRAGYEQDWTGRFRGETPVVLRPRDVDEVAAVMACCDGSGVAVVPQGGNTGLVGGGVPLRGELVLSTSRLDDLDPVDVRACQVTAGAGVSIGRLQSHARDSGLEYTVDLASRDSATIGGTIATNAGGLHFLRHGGTRQQLVGIEAVLADGRVVRHMEGLTKDNTGYDLSSLLCGSEGTLGIITSARLRLQPAREHRLVVLAGFDSVVDAVDAASAWRGRLDCLDALELFLQAGLDLVCATTGMPPPFPQPDVAYLLIEASSGVDPTEPVAAVVTSDARVVSVAVAEDSRRAASLWAYRESHTAAINSLGAPHKLDVALPTHRLADFIARVPEAVAEVTSSARTWLFGHVGDGNIHVNVTGLENSGEGVGNAVDDAVLELVAGLGGSISAEHGIGTLKKPWLHLNRTPVELDVFRAIKRALDPNGTLNPNVLLPN